MKTIRLRRLAALCIPALVSLAVAATAQTPPPAASQRRAEAKERREDAKERREDAKERREDAKEKREDAKERIEDAKEKREDVKERREDRVERRKARVKELREKWGDLARKPVGRAEIKVHAHRMARLRRIREVAETKGKTAVVARVDKLIERENNRHQRAMDRIKAQGG